MNASDMDDVSASLRQMICSTSDPDNSNSVRRMGSSVREDELMNQLNMSFPTPHKKLTKKSRSLSSIQLETERRQKAQRKRLREMQSRAKSLNLTNEPLKLESEKVYEGKVDVSLEEIKAARARKIEKKASRSKLLKEESIKKTNSKNKRTKSPRHQPLSGKLLKSEPREKRESKGERVRSRTRQASATRLPELEPMEKMGFKSERAKSTGPSSGKISKEEPKEEGESKKKRGRRPKRQGTTGQLPELKPMEKSDSKSEGAKSPRRQDSFDDALSLMSGWSSDDDFFQAEAAANSRGIANEAEEEETDTAFEIIRSVCISPKRESIDPRINKASKHRERSPIRQTSTGNLPELEPMEKSSSKSERAKSPRRQTSSGKLIKEEPRENRDTKSQRVKNPKRQSLGSSWHKNESTTWKWEKEDPMDNSSTSKRTPRTSSNSDRRRREISQSVSSQRKSLNSSSRSLSSRERTEPDKHRHDLESKSEHQPKKEGESLLRIKTIHTTTPPSGTRGRSPRHHTLYTKRSSDLSPLREEEDVKPGQNSSDPSGSLKDRKERGHRGDRRTDDMAPSHHRALPLGGDDSTSRRRGNDLTASSHHHRRSDRERARRKADLSPTRHSICGRRNIVDCGDDSPPVLKRRLSSRCLKKEQEQTATRRPFLVGNGSHSRRSISLSPPLSVPVRMHSGRRSRQSITSQQSIIPADQLERLGLSLDDSLLASNSDDEEEEQQRTAARRPTLGNRRGSNISLCLSPVHSMAAGMRSSGKPSRQSITSRQSISRQSIISAVQLGQLAGLSLDDSNSLVMSDGDDEEKAEPLTTQSYHAPSNPYNNKRMSVIGRTGPRMTADSLREKLQLASAQLDESSNSGSEEKKGDETAADPKGGMDASSNGEAEMDEASKLVEDGSSNDRGGMNASPNGAVAMSASSNNAVAMYASSSNSPAVASKKISASPEDNNGSKKSARSSILDDANVSSRSLNITPTDDTSLGRTARQNSSRSLNGLGSNERKARRRNDNGSKRPARSSIVVLPCTKAVPRHAKKGIPQKGIAYTEEFSDLYDDEETLLYGL